jgi:hypothetical protein
LRSTHPDFSGIKGAIAVEQKTFHDFRSHSVDSAVRQIRAPEQFIAFVELHRRVGRIGQQMK